MENLEDKGEKLKKYLQDMEWYQYQIKELFICRDISEKDFNQMITDSQASYRKFLDTLKPDSK